MLYSPQKKTYDKNSPFRHPIIKDIFISQWFSNRGDGVKCPEAFHNSPLSLLALIATVVSIPWFFGFLVIFDMI
jgi:hypothetical protein